MQGFALQNVRFDFIMGVFLLLYHVATHIWLQCCWDADAFWCLVVFEKGSHDTRESESRAVKCVAESNFLVLCAAVTTVQTVGLVGVEIRCRRYL